MRGNKYFYQNTLTGLEAGCLLSAGEVKMISRVKLGPDDEHYYFWNLAFSIFFCLYKEKIIQYQTSLPNWGFNEIKPDIVATQGGEYLEVKINMERCLVVVPRDLCEKSNMSKMDLWESFLCGGLGNEKGLPSIIECNELIKSKLGNN